MKIIDPIYGRRRENWFLRKLRHDAPTIFIFGGTLVIIAVVFLKVCES